MIKMQYIEAIRMAAWASDKVLRDVIIEQALQQYKRTGTKLEYVEFEESERVQRARHIYDARKKELQAQG